MQLTINRREVDGVVILELGGKLILGPEAERLRDDLMMLVNDRAPKVLLDLGGLGFVDSSGMGALVGSAAMAKDLGVQIKFVNPTETLMKVLEIAHLTEVLDIHQDEKSALDSFK